MSKNTLSADGTIWVDLTEEEENVKQPEMDKLVLASKLFPGLLSSEESLAQAQSELNRTYEQARTLASHPPTPPTPRMLSSCA